MNYRADIDGIRAIAVSLVILFHYGIGGFSGGFIGVDVFFVLSGYLISSIVFSQLERGRFSFAHFYFRRIRRLFPVYVVVMLLTFVVAYIVMLPLDFQAFGASLLASMLYISNILFFLEAGYFDTASHLKPLLHTWSLSVEEQFYLVFPLLAWLTARFSRRVLFLLFGVLTLVSLAAAAVYIDVDASAVFYLYPFRAWEMFLGTLLATGVIPPLASRAQNNAAALAGLALIFIPTFWYDDSTLFPGIAALPPCLGTLLLLHSGVSHGGWVQQILASRGAVFIGKLSYSLYLWHWPIYVLYAYGKSDGVDYGDTAIMALCTFTASVLSWRFIEVPFRHGTVKFSASQAWVFSGAAVISVVFVALGFYTYWRHGLPERLDPKTAQFAAAANDLFGGFEGCEEEGNARLPQVSYCVLGDPFNAESYTLFWGDSHGAAYKRGYGDLIDGKNLHALVAWTGGCAPVIGFNKDESVSSTLADRACRGRNQAIMDLIAQDPRIDAVVLIGRWSYYLNGGGVGVDAHNTITIWPDGQRPGSLADEGEYFTGAIYATMQALAASGKSVFVVEQPPEFSRYMPRKIAIDLMRDASSMEANVARFAVENYANVLARQGRIQPVFRAAQAEGLATILPTHKFFCNGDMCSAMIDGSPVYFDNNHVSSYGAVQIKHMFSPLLEYLQSR